MTRRSPSLLARALDHDYAAAFSIGAGALTALVWSATSSSYQRAMSAWPADVTGLGVSSFRGFVGTTLMTVFFFAVGLEVARERHHGALRDPRHALAPMLAALGGMAGPALLVVIAGLLTRTPALVHAWGVPMATDVAFTLAVLALVGSKIPGSLRAFLLTLAITDDVASIVLLAATGATHVDVANLIEGSLLALGVGVVSRWHRSVPWRVAVLALMWWALARSGVEPPLAGVAAGLLVPFEARRSVHLERAVTRVSVAVVLPLFALAYCGIEWSHLASATAITIVVAIVVARLLGKAVGISLGVGVARRLGARVAEGVSGRVLSGAAILCAIGVTVPLLFAGRLFRPASAAYGALDLGLVVASVIAALLGVVLLRAATRHREGEP
jgi:Na+:H+ antiporter, NhaA family